MKLLHHELKCSDVPERDVDHQMTAVAAQASSVLVLGGDGVSPAKRPSIDEVISKMILRLESGTFFMVAG
jgi:hypothetical protein